MTGVAPLESGESRQKTRIRGPALLGIVLAIYGVSFCLPAVNLRSGRDPVAGYEAFYRGMTFPPLLPTWMANPVFWAGCFSYVLGRYTRAAVLGLSAALLGVSQCLLFESNTLKIGFFTWFTAMLLLAISGFVMRGRPD